MLIELLILCLILGLIVWLARQYLPHPFPMVINVVAVIIVIIWLLRLMQGGGGRLLNL